VKYAPTEKNASSRGRAARVPDDDVQPEPEQEEDPDLPQDLRDGRPDDVGEEQEQRRERDPHDDLDRPARVEAPLQRMTFVVERSWNGAQQVADRRPRRARVAPAATAKMRRRAHRRGGRGFASSRANRARYGCCRARPARSVGAGRAGRSPRARSRGALRWSGRTRCSSDAITETTTVTAERIAVPTQAFEWNDRIPMSTVETERKTSRTVSAPIRFTTPIRAAITSADPSPATSPPRVAIAGRPRSAPPPRPWDAWLRTRRTPAARATDPVERHLRPDDRRVEDRSTIPTRREVDRHDPSIAPPRRAARRNVRRFIPSRPRGTEDPARAEDPRRARGPRT